tara:strand:- start:111 stop:671 length:561 start_codon:yes stop_codon:yes gene_type:complete
MSISQLRIIGGKWRSRKINFLPEPTLRPTGDRLRETLFNWLGPSLRQARCLDAFAGSGALGFEALSRGAAFCQFWDNNLKVVKQLKETCQTLQAQELCQIEKADTQLLLNQSCGTPFDIIFLDPPFANKSLSNTLDSIFKNHWISPDGFVSVEADASDKLDFGLNWIIHRSKVASGVQIHLLRPVE